MTFHTNSTFKCGLRNEDTCLESIHGDNWQEYRFLSLEDSFFYCLPEAIEPDFCHRKEGEDDRGHAIGGEEGEIYPG